MADSALQPLLERLAEVSGPVLWLADESNGTALASLANYGQSLTLITNRFDIAEDAQARKIQTHFSDFDFNPLKNFPTQVFYRVSKERPLVNHIINEVFSRLPVGGSLWLSGQKSEGIKTYFTQAAKLFGSHTKLKKEGTSYWGKLEKHAANGVRLDDKHYNQIRWIPVAENDGFYSKPGTYGWDKVDKGSAFLVEQLPTLLDGIHTSHAHFLDLGCGYGYLTLQCREQGFKSMTATDNNAAAITCSRANAAHFSVPVKIVADDCAAHLRGPYDVILCNPPFHQGFSVESTLTDKFLQAARRLLSPGGHACFVVNCFIPLEAKAKKLFNPDYAVTVAADNGQFKVVDIQYRRK